MHDSPQSRGLLTGISNGLQETCLGEHVVNCQERKGPKVKMKTKQNQRMRDEKQKGEGGGNGSIQQGTSFMLASNGEAWEGRGGEQNGAAGKCALLLYTMTAPQSTQLEGGYNKSVEKNL